MIIAGSKKQFIHFETTWFNPQAQRITRTTCKHDHDHAALVSHFLRETRILGKSFDTPSSRPTPTPPLHTQMATLAFVICASDLVWCYKLS